MLKSERLMRCLKYSLKQKILKDVMFELDSHWSCILGIVSICQVKGTKRKGHDYFGMSTAIRHVYDNTSSCSYNDSYDGEVFIYIGKKRYLNIHISG